MSTIFDGTAQQVFKRGFDSEGYLVLAVKEFLRTPAHKVILDQLDLSIEDCLNGRFGEAEEEAVLKIFADWNTSLGWKEFGF